MFCFRNPVCYHCVTQLLPLQANVWLLAEIYNTISSQTECSLSRVTGKLQRMQSDEIVNRIRVCEMSITNNIRTTKNYEYALTPTAYKYLTKRPELLEQMTGRSGK